MWFAYSLFFAAWTSVAILISKKLTKGISPALLFILVLLFSFPFLTAMLLIFGIPTFTKDFFILLFIAGILDTIAAIFYYKALSMSDVSLLAPISSFNPIFTLIFAAVLLQENPTTLKLIGILIIIAGSYLLNISDIRAGILKPFTLLFSNKGVRLFLISIFIWGITPVFQKKAIFETSPETPIAVPLVELIIILIFLSPLLIKLKSKKIYLRTNLKILILFAGMSALGQLAAMNAFLLSNVAYAASIFKLSTLFTVIFGAVFFHEKRIRERLLGAAVMVLGTILIAI